MKFISKFILIYLVVTVIVLGIGGYISYFIIQDELNNELKWRLLDRVERVTDLLKQGKDFKGAMLDGADEENLVVQRLPSQMKERTAIEDTLVWHHRLEQMEPNLKLTAYRTVDDTTYLVSTYGALVETDDITEAVSEILLWILLMQIIGAVVMGFIISNRLFKSFRKTIDKIKRFEIQNKKPIKAESTSVKEFDDLNKFVEQMTEKAIRDYENLKEFAENASHELKTPLAISSGKLELLAETSLTKNQHQYVEDTQRTISKLSKLGTSLSLLTKIDNEEFTGNKEVDFTQIIKESISAFRELIELNDLTIEKELESDVTVFMPPVLADILWTNLFQNAIKHNVDDGHIDIKLTAKKLVIANSGPVISDDPKEYFNRFKKSNPASDSVGLGLAIVKRITDQNNFGIAYKVKKSTHIIEVSF